MRVALRWVGRGLLALLIVVVGLWGYLEVRQWTLRLRAQRLLADVKQLRVKDGTWEDLERFRAKWGKWGDCYGRCDSAECTYLVNLDDAFPPVMYGKDGDFRPLRARFLLEVLGLRKTWIRAGVTVRGGKVVAKNFLEDVDLPMWSDAKYLTVISYEGPHLETYMDIEHRAIHPNHSLDDGKYFIAGATSSEDAEEKAMLMRFHFDCITTLLPCVDRRRVLPEAYDEYEKQAGVGSHLNSGCDLPLWVHARDQEFVFVGNVVKATRETTYGGGEPSPPYWALMIHVERLLKGKLDTPLDQVIPAQLFESEEQKKEAAFLHKSFVVMGTSGLSWNDGSMDADECDFIEASPANLADVQRGISEDFAPQLR